MGILLNEAALTILQCCLLVNIHMLPSQILKLLNLGAKYIPSRYHIFRQMLKFISNGQKKSFFL